MIMTKTQFESLLTRVLAADEHSPTIGRHALTLLSAMARHDPNSGLMINMRKEVGDVFRNPYAEGVVAHGFMRVIIQFDLPFTLAFDGPPRMHHLVQEPDGRVCALRLRRV
jgi:hypothetical protein